MSRSREDAERFLDTCAPAVRHLFKELPDLRGQRDRLASRIKDLEEHCEAIRTNAFANIPFAPDDPDQPSAFQKLVWGPLKSHELELAALNKQLAQLGVELGATQESTLVLAGAVLQIAKQVLSYRFTGKPKGLRNEKMIGSQPITNVIWEGRNHAMHYETGPPNPPVAQMLAGLGRDFKTLLRADQNNSLAILDLLGWNEATAVLTDLRDLISSE